ncbi:YlxR family protein [Paenibacillus sp. TRM 82003]|uniref:YlxR family protein n=1 Tax=Kineococcus sp. TRM81007 TaxID=2925831 RepID=UPI001F58ABEE|nr:YlxR family protein [Kineococcus sp. TRM81007]MCI2240262.1 YlxR family protein [Kineococcus sp. TRM81007]MCI3927561.1 YlxR family protein [Paenibacillus sp. TRM 82003]
MTLAEAGPARRRPTTPAVRPASSSADVEHARTCVGCRRRGSRSELLRVVASAEGDEVLVDERRRLPGRGAWLHHSTACLDRAEKRRALPRALRRPGPLDTSGVRSHLEPPTGAVASTTTDENGSNS